MDEIEPARSMHDEDDDPGRAAQTLAGGVAHEGHVVRIGDRVRRPAGPHTETVHALLRHVRARGFDGVPLPLSIEPAPLLERADGAGAYEELTYVAGDVPTRPFPAWFQTDAALGSVARLLRGFHDASAGFLPRPGAVWDRELADGGAPEVVCHNDVCPENVVFRDGTAVALLDFDFAAPGRRVFDLASFACMCVPIDHPRDALGTGWGLVDPFSRLRTVADEYGLSPDRQALVEAIGERVASHGAFVRRRVEAGEEAFVRMWELVGGAARYERRDAWFRTHRERLLDTVG